MATGFLGFFLIVQHLQVCNAMTCCLTPWQIMIIMIILLKVSLAYGRWRFYVVLNSLNMINNDFNNIYDNDNCQTFSEPYDNYRRKKSVRDVRDLARRGRLICWSEFLMNMLATTSSFCRPWASKFSLVPRLLFFWFGLFLVSYVILVHWTKSL